MWYVLNRVKNYISDFSDFYISSYSYFWLFFTLETANFRRIFMTALNLKIGKLIFHSIQQIVFAYPYLGQGQLNLLIIIYD